ncbi:MAG TPA: S-adenosylmethionine tRNA ribosyltransferase, partial [Crocinitomicaceae bacterium]|nr:S-adenosylmethionine tRNA ribosyltransferase [Crocinitomicaceae bacterium]
MKEHVTQLSMSAFKYELPDDKIAYFPAEPRDSSKLLVFNNGRIEDHIYNELPQHLPENTFLIANDTKVVEARLLFEKTTGAKIEIFCLEPDERYADVVSGMQQKGEVFWKCLIGGAKKWKDELLNLSSKDTVLHVKKTSLSGSPAVLHFSWNDHEMTFAEILHLFGNIPLPPYIKRKTEKQDQSDYQTIYAQYKGSVAAPTAGLHFTKNLLEQLQQKGIHSHFVTLHVGAGTFMPVKSETLGGHEMHAEFLDVSITFIRAFLENNEKKVCVGTTSLRTLESLYWMGVKVLSNSNISIEEIKISQWDAYELPQDFSVESSFIALENWMKSAQLRHLVVPTQLLIAPGYSIRTVDA